MANLLSRNAKYEEVILDEIALQFHVDAFKAGQRYKLALNCYQYFMSKNA